MLVEMVVEVHKHILNSTAARTNDVRVAIGTQIKAFSTWCLNRENLALLGKKMQVAIDRSAAYMAVAIMNCVVDLLNCGVIVARAHDIEHELALPCVPSVGHVHPPSSPWCVYVRYSKKNIIRCLTS